MKIKKALMILLLMFMGMFLNGKVLAANTTERTTILDLSAAEFTNDKENESEGWKWVSSTNTLTLTNVNFNTGNQNSIKVPTDRDINIVLNGKNKLTSNNTTITRQDIVTVDNTSVIFKGTGEIVVKSNNELPTIDANNIIVKNGTINFVGGSVNTLHSIKIEGGKVIVDTSSVSDNGWNDGFYACGGIEISGGTIDINASRIGLFVPGSGAANPTTGLKITGGNVSFFGNMSGAYIGMDNPKDVYINTTGIVDSKSSSIGIYVYDGNLNIINGKLKYEAGKTFYKMGSNNTTGVANIKEADYAKVNNAIAKIPSDLSKYTESSIRDLENAKQAVVNGKNILEQNIVDEYATKIEKAIRELKYKDADYAKVEEAIAKIPTDLSMYTEESINKLNDTKNNVIRGKNISEQSIVDGYATKIEKAIRELKYKDADYAKVEEAIAKIPTDLSLYTEETLKKLMNAKNNVIRGKNILEQSIVNGYGVTIEDAIKALKYKKADYTNVDKAIAKIPSKLNVYTFETVEALNKVVESIIRDKDITQQDEVDLYVGKIEEAIKGLEKITEKDTANKNESKTINSDIVETGDEVGLISGIFLSAIISICIAFKIKL